MNRSLGIIVLLCLFTQMNLQAQELTNAQKRLINLRVLTAVEQYERTAALSDEEEVYMFKELFPSLDSTYVVMDMMGTKKYMSKVSVQEYVNTARANTLGLNLNIYDVRKGKVSFSNGVWKIPVNFSKDVSYIDNNSVLFSSEEFYKGVKYDVQLNLEYNPDDDRCLITSIEQKIDESAYKFPMQRFYIINKDNESSKRDARLEKRIFKHNQLEYNSFDQVFVEQDKLKPWHSDVAVKYDKSVESDNYDVVRLKYDKLKWRAKARWSHTCSREGGMFSVSTSDSRIQTVSSARERGMDIGRAALVGKHGALSYYTGIAMSTTKLNLSTGGIQYQYMTTSSDGNVYERAYELDTVVECVTYNDWVVPAYVSWEFFGRIVQVGLSAGVKFYFAEDDMIDGLKGIQGVSDSYMSVKGNIRGAYGKYMPLDMSFVDFLAPTSYGMSMSYSYVFGLSLNFRLFKNMSLYGKASHEFGSGSFHTATQTKFFSAGDYNYPLVYSAQINGEIAVKSLLSCVSLTRKALWCEGGLIFKF